MITVFLYYTVLYTVVLGKTLKSSTNHSLEIQSASQIEPDCPDGFKLDHNLTLCYLYSYDYTNPFKLALLDCMYQESNLAEPKSTEEKAIFFELAKGIDNPYAIWIGNWFTVKHWDVEVDFCETMLVEPFDQYENETKKWVECAILWPEYDYFCITNPIAKKYGENCSELAKCSSEFVCYEFRCSCGPYKHFLQHNETCGKNNNDIKESASLILPGCPKDFALKVIDNLARCYKYSSDSDTFLDAVFACQREGSILAEPRSPMENANIFGLAAINRYPKAIWIGITGNNTGRDVKYHSDNGGLEWAHWLMNYRYYGELHCVKMILMSGFNTFGPWAYYNCSAKSTYVCQASPIEKKHGENCSELAKCSSEFVCDNFRCSCGPDEHFLPYNETCGKNDIKDKSKKPGGPKSSRYNDLLRYGGLTLLILALLILPCCVFYFLRKRKKSVSEEPEEQTEMTYSWSTMNKSEPNKSKPNKSKPNKSKPNTSKPNKSKPNTSKPNTSKPNKSKPILSKPNTSKPNTSEPNTSTGYTSEPNTSTGYTSDPYTSTTYPTGEPTSSPEWTSAISASTKT